MPHSKFRFCVFVCKLFYKATADKSDSLPSTKILNKRRTGEAAFRFSPVSKNQIKASLTSKLGIAGSEGEVPPRNPCNPELTKRAVPDLRRNWSHLNTGSDFGWRGTGRAPANPSVGQAPGPRSVSRDEVPTLVG